MTAPQSIASSTLNIAGVELRVHVLEDGQRVIEPAGVAALFAMFERGVVLTAEDAMKIARAVRGIGGTP